MSAKVALVTGGSPVAVVTGGSRGIGFGIARRLAAQGWNLALGGRREDDAVAPAVEEVEGLGVAAVYIRGDVALAETRSRLVEGTLERFGRIDALVNNAGITSVGRLDFLQAGESSFDEVIGVNLKGPYFLAQLTARVMIEQRSREPGFRGKIVNVTSVNATVSSVTRGDYCMSKAGLSAAHRVMAARLAEYGIDCFEVRPGLIATDMTAAVRQKYDALIAEGMTLEPRWGTPDDVGSIVAAALRGDVPYSTGQVFVVDGGLTLQRF